MGRIVPLPAEILATTRLRLERERADLKRFLFTVETALEEHVLCDVKPWLLRLQDRIAEYDARIARYAVA
jgi:hypothetical protein